MNSSGAFYSYTEAHSEPGQTSKLEHLSKMGIRFWIRLCYRWLKPLILLTALKIRSCKLYNHRYVIASTQITNTEFFAFITVQVFTLFGNNFKKLLKSRVLFKKIAKIMGKLLQRPLLFFKFSFQQ